MLLRLLLFLISLGIYFYAPHEFNHSYCVLCFVLWLIECFIVLKHDYAITGSIISFNFIFCFSFFWTSFAYAIIVYGTDAGVLNLISQNMNWGTLSKTSALCLLFFSGYMLGYGKRTLVSTKIDPIIIQRGLGIRPLIWVFFLCLMALTFFNLYRAGWNYADFDQNTFLYDFLYISIGVYALARFVTISRSHHSFSVLFKKEWMLLCGIIFFFILFMVFGDRGPALRIGLLCFALYHLYYKKIPIKKVLILGLIGVCFMFFVRQTRTSDSSLAKDGFSAVSNMTEIFSLDEGVVYIFADLYGCNMELNLAYEYVQNYGLYKPERLLTLPTMVLPFLPTIVLAPFGLNTDDFNTGAELNRYMSQYDPHFGNNIVGDCYMSFGLLGVIFFSIMFGVVVGKIFEHQHHHVWFRVAYVILISFALYLPRDSMFSLIRPLSLCYLMCYFLLYKFVKK